MPGYERMRRFNRTRCRERFPSEALRLSFVSYKCRTGIISLGDVASCDTDCWLTADGKVWVSSDSRTIHEYTRHLDEEI
ncbi:hypothetical protein ACJ73_02232 [Blastomyces percursus]|uniref:Uncharacterized protein n=1 Tax=Blastomyces percursus TaxID=1658174 RepID=A0A1J9QCY4_9EURO|nr:hypothetical protein ACJ73_02232 [Blastomyces percursus]